MDVVLLYTNIPHNKAIQYISEHYTYTFSQWNNNNTNLMPIPVNLLKELLNFALSNCTFDIQWYSP